MRKTEIIAAALKPSKEPALSEARTVRDGRDRLATALTKLETLVSHDALPGLGQLRAALDGFAVRVSLIGQVKAGKTALTNALIGQSGLLPSDVNPWTSVITAVHVNTPAPAGKDAVFTFFTDAEWNNMVTAGGYLGEMAMRANYEDELAELRAQIVEMQERTKTRLGRNFNLLLNSRHSFLGFSPELIKKYVSLGEDEADAAGRYADVTRSADIYLRNDDYILPTIVSDTPGVNDPFLIREAVTLDNLSGTDICVVVLSAHQAFSTVDIGLLRVILALKHKDLVLFVNRVDELQDPDRQVVEIDGFIRELLKEQQLPTDIPIVFGSAAWAEAAGGETPDVLDDDAEETLAQLASARAAKMAEQQVQDINVARPGSAAWNAGKCSDLSGLHELRTIMQERGAVHVGRPALEALRDQAVDVARQSLVYLRTASDNGLSVKEDLDMRRLSRDLDGVLQQAEHVCEAIAKELTKKVLFMMSASFRTFIVKGERSLRAHLAAHKDIRDWAPDSEALRRDLNRTHDEFVAMAPGMVNAMFARTAGRIEQIYWDVLGSQATLFSIHPPLSEKPKTPVALMRTLAVELGAGWFSNWFTSTFNPDAQVKKFEAIAQAEMQATLQEMQEVYVVTFMKGVRGQVHQFLSEHMQTLRKLAALREDDKREDVLRTLGVAAEIRERIAAIETVLGELDGVFDTSGTSTESRSVA